MRVFRGPAQKDFQDKSHEKVATVGATELRNAIEKNSYFTFNITKAEDCERQSVCSADFDDTDICFIMVAASKKLRIYSNAIQTIDKILKIEATSEKKFRKLKKYVKGSKKMVKYLMWVLIFSVTRRKTTRPSFSFGAQIKRTLSAQINSLFYSHFITQNKN